MKTNHEFDEDPIARELLRIMGVGKSDGLANLFMILPLVDEADALRFLKSVPNGATPEQIQCMVDAYRIANPLSGE
jgi:hypothetical protein